jgi:hypothetical protein
MSWSTVSFVPRGVLVFVADMLVIALSVIVGAS